VHIYNFCPGITASLAVEQLLKWPEIAVGYTEIPYWYQPFKAKDL
ncbi:5956_t:CDS:1, partial [Funneliformis mosseae]